MSQALSRETERLRGEVAARLAPHAAHVEKVLAAATKAHEGQTRSNGDPYVVHPIRVALVALAEWDRREPDLVCAALLHDTVEDTSFTLDDVAALTGPRVRELVDLLTKADPLGYPSKADRDREYFARLRAGPEGASVVKCADRVDNLRDMAGSTWSLAKKRAYVDEARALILPVARERAPWAAARLEAVCAEVERGLGPS